MSTTDSLLAELRNSIRGEVELELYEEFDKRLKQARDHLVEKVDFFLRMQSDSFYESLIKGEGSTKFQQLMREVRNILEDDLHESKAKRLNKTEASA